MTALINGRWRFAAHLGVSSPETPQFLNSAASADPVDQIDYAAKLGFAGITDNCLLLRSADDQRRIGTALKNRNMEMGTFVLNPPGAAKLHWCLPAGDMSAALSPVFAAASRVGGGLINAMLHDCGAARDEQLAIAKTNLRRAAELAQAEGQILGLEAASAQRVPSTLVQRISEAAAMVDAVDHPSLGLIMDSCHAHFAGEDLPALIRTHASRLFGIQIADMPGRVEPDAGTLDLRAVMSALADINWAGLVEAEFFASAPGVDGEAAVARALQALNRR